MHILHSKTKMKINRQNRLVFVVWGIQLACFPFMLDKSSVFWHYWWSDSIVSILFITEPKKQSTINIKYDGILFA